MTDTIPFAAAVQQYRTALATAMRFNDANLSEQGNAQRRRDIVSKARADLLAKRPLLPQSGESRDSVLASMTATTADEIARLQHAQSKVRARLDAGQPLSRIIADADEQTALAIADLVDTLPQVLQSNDGAAIVDETRSLVFDRLADLGVERAATSRDMAQRNAPAIAWHAAMTEAAEHGNASIGAWANVHRADADGYNAVRDSFDGQVDEWLRRLDATEG
ncbi:hypothetical protein [Microbacterium sp. bgisy189]|uniref:hypothetical protein n=1 Tax=Microbacterium sp. bgisy189 TaxID=3413798 RepID=UPI003EBF3654